MAGALPLVLAAVLICAVSSADAVKLLITGGPFLGYLKIARSGATPGGSMVSSAARLGNIAQIGQVQFTAVKGSLAFTFSSGFNQNSNTQAVSNLTTYLTVSNVAGTKPKVGKAIKLNSVLAAKGFKGCIADYNQGSAAATKIGKHTYRVYATVACLQACRAKGVNPSANYVLAFSYNSATRKVTVSRTPKYRFGSNPKCLDRKAYNYVQDMKVAGSKLLLAVAHAGGAANNQVDLVTVPSSKASWTANLQRNCGNAVISSSTLLYATCYDNANPAASAIVKIRKGSKAFPALSGAFTPASKGFFDLNVATATRVYSSFRSGYEGRTSSILAHGTSSSPSVPQKKVLPAMQQAYWADLDIIS